MRDRRSESGRLTPYELVFGSTKLAEDEFPTIAAEAERRGIEAGKRDRFAQLESVAHLIGRLVPETAEMAAFDRYLDTLYHCFHFWRSGLQLVTLEEALARSLVEDPPDLSGWSPGARGGLYIELPRNLFWADVIANDPPEPVEGMFVRTDRDGDRSVIEILLVLGMRADRPGFSTAGLTVELEELSGSEPDAFRSDIPGADLAGLYSLGRPSEAVSLALASLWYMERYPEAAERVEADAAAESSAVDVGPTSLDHVRLQLNERDRE
ncbi:MAG: hypothetical protein GWN99_14845 [Gemmatimonadetes bacterium]|uniref:Uncharacterized protein n=1 Tax=Candidatus Kutchimonas denitrificans TaxID=3056748 RepID=A0AAE4ZCW7_9BACT|nr:hypothetical protein [Gemmatimonadota bacterium]NIR76301.1 hypothetical protein [Candidatus Kutchimonas denitrificans]NIS02324.1 hypothetical protein [Gemmatimonadota bacterium]NIT68143.1 hypothetical protein [Gemmatimonadota bacterium]NIU54367.1 hypothetical protein [Gemmatimonadota bacterium]